MRYYIIWFTDVNDVGEYENYVIMEFNNQDEAWKKAAEMFGDYVISVEPYNH